jgi:hypothetical protein
VCEELIFVYFEALWVHVMHLPQLFIGKHYFDDDFEFKFLDLYLCVLLINNCMIAVQICKIYNHITGENVQTQTFRGARSRDTSGPA